jgi:hypothetical protein
MKSLRTLYEEHQGKVSDKWELYLDVYERILATWRTKPSGSFTRGTQTSR